MFRVIAASTLAIGAVVASGAAAVSAAPPDSTVPPVEAPVNTEATATLEGGGDSESVPVVAGEPVTFVDNSGTALATMSVVAFEQEWAGFAEFYEPDSGYHYTRVVVSITSQSPRGLFEVDEDSFRLQDADGFAFSSYAVPTPEQDSTDVEPITSGSLHEGESIELELTFEVVAGVEPTALYFAPSYDRLLTIQQFN